MDTIKIGKLIYALRKEKNMTQLQLAERMHISDKTVSKWEIRNILQRADEGIGPYDHLFPETDRTWNVTTSCFYLETAPF